MYGGLTALKSDCLLCRSCPLETTRTNVVFGVGNENADIMFVGEGPGENEDLKGEPFVGKAGQLLDKYLSVIDLDRKKNVYIANIVKCRPPKNRDPMQTEQDACIGFLRAQTKLIQPKACIPWLRAQTKLIKPKIIVCLGRIAAQRLIDPEFRVTKQHGQFIKKGNILFMGTFHPAALLRNEAQKPDALSDFSALREKIAELGIEI